MSIFDLKKKKSSAPPNNNPPRTSSDSHPSSVSSLRKGKDVSYAAPARSLANDSSGTSGIGGNPISFGHLTALLPTSKLSQSSSFPSLHSPITQTSPSQMQAPGSTLSSYTNQSSIPSSQFSFPSNDHRRNLSGNTESTSVYAGGVGYEEDPNWSKLNDPFVNPGIPPSTSSWGLQTIRAVTMDRMKDSSGIARKGSWSGSMTSGTGGTGFGREKDKPDLSFVASLGMAPITARDENLENIYGKRTNPFPSLSALNSNANDGRSGSGFAGLGLSNIEGVLGGKSHFPSLGTIGGTSGLGLGTGKWFVESNNDRPSLNPRPFPEPTTINRAIHQATQTSLQAGITNTNIIPFPDSNNAFAAQALEQVHTEDEGKFPNDNLLQVNRTMRMSTSVPELRNVANNVQNRPLGYNSKLHPQLMSKPLSTAPFMEPRPSPQSSQQAELTPPSPPTHVDKPRIPPTRSMSDRHLGQTFKSKPARPERDPDSVFEHPLWTQLQKEVMSAQPTQNLYEVYTFPKPRLKPQMVNTLNIDATGTEKNVEEEIKDALKRSKSRSKNRDKNTLGLSIVANASSVGHANLGHNNLDTVSSPSRSSSFMNGFVKGFELAAAGAKLGALGPDVAEMVHGLHKSASQVWKENMASRKEREGWGDVEGSAWRKASIRSRKNTIDKGRKRTATMPNDITDNEGARNTEGIHRVLSQKSSKLVSGRARKRASTIDTTYAVAAREILHPLTQAPGGKRSLDSHHRGKSNADIQHNIQSPPLVTSFGFLHKRKDNEDAHSTSSHSHLPIMGSGESKSALLVKGPTRGWDRFLGRKKEDPVDNLISTVHIPISTPPTSPPENPKDSNLSPVFVDPTNLSSTSVGRAVFPQTEGTNPARNPSSPQPINPEIKASYAIPLHQRFVQYTNQSTQLSNEDAILPMPTSPLQSKPAVVPPRQPVGLTLGRRPGSGVSPTTALPSPSATITSATPTSPTDKKSRRQGSVDLAPAWKVFSGDALVTPTLLTPGADYFVDRSRKGDGLGGATISGEDHQDSEESFPQPPISFSPTMSAVSGSSSGQQRGGSENSGHSTVDLDSVDFDELFFRPPGAPQPERINEVLPDEGDFGVHHSSATEPPQIPPVASQADNTFGFLAGFLDRRQSLASADDTERFSSRASSPLSEVDWVDAHTPVVAGRTNSEFISDLVTEYTTPKFEDEETNLRTTYPSSEAFGAPKSLLSLSRDNSHVSLASYYTEIPEVASLKQGPVIRSSISITRHTSEVMDRPHSMVPSLYNDDEVVTPSNPSFDSQKIAVTQAEDIHNYHSSSHSPVVAAPRQTSPDQPAATSPDLRESQYVEIPENINALHASASSVESSFLDMGSPREERFGIPEFASPLPGTPSTARASSMARPRSTSWIDFDQTSLFQPSLHRISKPSFLELDKPDDDVPQLEEFERASFLDMSPPESPKRSLSLRRRSMYDSIGTDPRASLDIPVSRNPSHRGPVSASSTGRQVSAANSRRNSENPGSERANSYLSIYDLRFNRLAFLSSSPDNRDSYLSSNMSLSSLSQIHNFPPPPQGGQGHRHSVPESIEQPRHRRSLSVSDMDAAERRSLDSTRQRFSTSSLYPSLLSTVRLSEDSGVEPLWTREALASRRKFFLSRGLANEPILDDETGELPS